MNRTQLYKLLKKHRQQTLTRAEEESLIKWYDDFDISSEANTEGRARIFQEPAYDHIQNQLFGNKPALEDKKVIPFYKHSYVKIAAAITLFFTLGYFFYPNPEEEIKPIRYSYKTIDCPEGKRLKVTLPDSSQLWLQGGTSLKYTENFAANRHIVLEKGEAFFEVKPDTNYPFSVKTPELTIQVVGTSFNVASYTKSESVEVVVSSGKVNVTDSATFDELLSLNQAMTYDKKTKALHIKLLKSDQISSSKEGIYYLQSIKLSELIIKLENFYGFHFVFKDKSIGESINSLEFNSTKPITDILNTLKLINNIQYKIDGKQILLSRI